MSDLFDFEAFIAGTHLPTIKVPLYRVDHSLEIKDLDEQIAKLPKDPSDEREGVKSVRADLTGRRDALAAEQDGSAQEFELRALSAPEFAEVSKPEFDVFDQIAVQSKGTANEACRDVWERVSASVTAMQWSGFVARANALVLSKVAVPDFSQPNSTTQAQRSSSES